MRASLIFVLLLAGCGSSPDSRICETAPTNIATGDIKACVHKWAYRLARSHDPAKVVADAVVNACNDVANYRSDGTPVGPTKEGLKAYDDARLTAENDALFRVVQARAGNCGIP